jgi:hypothetical protein
MSSEYEALSVDQLLTGLEISGRGPHLELIHAILGRVPEVVPGLLDMLATEPNENWSDNDPRWYKSIHAGLLLCALREPAALPIFGERLRDPDWFEMLDWFDVPLPDFYGPLAIPMLADLARDAAAYEEARTTAAGMLALIGVRHPDQREGVVETLRSLLPELDDDGQPILSSKERDEPPELWTWVVYALMGMRDTTTQPLVLALFEAEVIYSGIFGGRQDYLAALRPDARPAIGAGKRCDILELYQGYYDEVQAENRQKALAAKRQAEEARRGVRARPAGKPIKVGRNDPCPCGSGKKYKKCCGRRQ